MYGATQGEMSWDESHRGVEKNSVLARRLALAACALLVSLVAAEAVLRTVPSPLLGFKVEDDRFRRPAEFEVDETTNRFGFHDIDHGPKSRDQKRILLLGDSYVAIRMDLPLTVGRRLAHHTGADVVACAQGGWGQRDQLEVLQSLGPELKSDVVVTLLLPFNDVRDNSPLLDKRSAVQWHEMALRRPGWTDFPTDSAPGLLFKHSVLNQLISHRIFLFSHRSEDIPIDYLVYREDTDEPWSEAWRMTEQLLLETRDLAQEQDAQYLLVSASTPHGVMGPKKGLEFIQRSYPAMQQMSWDLDGPNRRLNEFCQSNGISFLSLEPIFRQHIAQTGERLHWRYNGHWNAAGNDLAVRHMAEFIRTHLDEASAAD